MKTPRTFRLSWSTVEKLSWLSRLFGDMTAALEIAIDRLYTSEKAAHDENSVDTAALGVADSDRMQNGRKS